MNRGAGVCPHCERYVHDLKAHIDAQHNARLSDFSGEQ